MVATGSENKNSGPILLLDGEMPGEIEFVLLGHQATCLCLGSDKLNKYMVSAGEDNLVGVWDCEEWVQMATLGIESQVRQLSIDSHSEYLAVVSEADEVAIYNLALLLQQADVQAQLHNNFKFAISCKTKQNTVKWHPHLSILAYAGDDKFKNTEDRGVVTLFSNPALL